MAAEFVRQVKLVLHSNGEESLCRVLASCKDSCLRTESFLTYLGLSSDDEPGCYPGEYRRQGILVELMVQTLNFAVEKGLPYAQIYHFLCLYVKCLELLCPKQLSDTSYNECSSDTCTEPTLSNAVKQFQGIIQTSDTHLSKEYLLLVVRYITQSLLQHFHLYQYCLSTEQPLDLTILKVNVETADSPQPLANSTTLLEYERQKRIRELEAVYTEKDQLFTGERELALQQEDEMLKESYKTQFTKLEDAPHLAESDVVEVIDSLAKAHTHAMFTAVSQEVKKQALDMEFHVDKLNVFAPKMMI